jgi:Mrp family chromosome partitioning ATPase
VALAEEVGEDVVVVDANLRSPALANDFGIWADGGLVEVVTGKKDWREVVRKTSAKHLCVLPGGRFAGEDGALPEDLKLASLLETLRRSHRLVLVDTASLQYPEVAPLSGLCDGTYLVVALGQTEQGVARQAARLIERCGGRVLGCVLTNA